MPYQSRRAVPVAVAAAGVLLLVSCGSEGPGSAASRKPVRAASRPVGATNAASLKRWDLFERDPIVTYSPAVNSESVPQYGVVFRTKGALPRNHQNGTRGQASLNGFGLQYVAQVAKAGRDVCYDGQLSQIDGPLKTTPPLFPYTAGQRVAVGYHVGTRQARPITVDASRGPALDDAQARKLARRLGCTQVAPHDGKPL